jgi:hypothetical protein
MGFVQLLGVVYLYSVLGHCGGEPWANYFAMSFYCAYFLLFVHELYLGLREKKAKKE